jgi:hypothetical protein
VTDGLDRLRSAAQTRGDAKKKGKETAPVPSIDPKILKWLLYGALGALFAVGVYVMVENASGGGDDPAERMKREMGITQGGEPSPASASASDWDRGMRLVGSSEPQERIDGMALLMNTDAGRAAGIVQSMLADADPTVRSAAAGRLAEYNIPGSGAVMIALLSDPDPAVRAAGADAMTKFAAEPGLIYLLATPLNSPDPSVVLNAIKVLKAAAVHDREAVAGAITGPLNSNDDQVLLAALDAAWNLTQDQLKNFRGTIEAVKARKAGTAVEPAANALLEEVARSEKYAGQ